MRRRRLLIFAAAFAVAGAAAAWELTNPAAAVSSSALPAYAPNIANGKTMFDAGDCASCHATPSANPNKLDRTRLGGGLAIATTFGVFYAPNISPDLTNGIGRWSEADFVSALRDGVAPGGRQLYPVFPYTSFCHMRLDDVRDLFAYLKTLPPTPGKNRRPDLRFPFNIRRLVGLWKRLYFHCKPFAPDPAKSAQWNRGAYLVNGPAHCAECHSPRNALGAIIASERFAGGPTPDGKHWVPNITPVGLREGDNAKHPWTQSDIASLLSEGVTPDGDFVGGAMADVVSNASLLSKSDRSAIAAYIASLPPRQGPKPPQENTKRAASGK